MRLRPLLKSIILAFLIFLSACKKEVNLDEFSREFESISSSFENKLKNNPDDFKLRIKLGQFYYKVKSYQKAKEILTDIEDRKCRILLAKTLARLKEFDYAIELFEQIKIEEPDKAYPEADSEYFYLYGYVLENKNLFPRAKEVYSKVKGRFKKDADERIALIELKIEQSFPSYIAKVVEEAKIFLKDLEDEAAIVYFVDENIEITTENTSVVTVHVLEQVLKERGKSLAEIEIGYDSTYERVELEFARSISEDGKIVYAGKETIRDVSKYLNFPLYSNSRAFIVSTPLVDVGSFIEYKLKIYSSKLVDEDDFTFLYRLKEQYPIFKSKFKLITPREREAHIKFFNQDYAGSHSLKPVQRIEEGKNVYLWKFESVKPLIPEYNMPPVSRVNPAVLISSFSSWDDIYNWWQSLFKDKLNLDKEIKQFTQSLIKDAKDDFEKAKKIYEFCAKNIRYVAVEYGESGHEPHYAKEVFINRYGDCKDQAILLVAMLREAGLKAYPVLIPTRGTYPIDKEFPSLNFNHAICVLELDGNLTFMDPTAETTSFLDIPLSDQDRPVMIFYDDGFRIVDTPELKENAVQYKMKILLNDEESATVERNVTTKGFYTSGHRWYLKYTHPLKIKEDIQKKIVEISSFSRLLDYKIENVDDFDLAPLLSYDFVTEKLLNPAGNLRIIPGLDEIRLDYDLIGKEDRDFPIDFDGIYSKEAEITIVLPESLKVKYLPQDINLETPWFRFKYGFKAEKNKIISSQNFEVRRRFVKNEEYKEFKKSLEKVFYLLREQIILERIN